MQHKGILGAFLLQQRESSRPSFVGQLRKAATVLFCVLCLAFLHRVSFVAVQKKCRRPFINAHNI